MAKKTDIEGLVVPEHIAIILDGNGRWAKKKHLPRNAGHAAGAKTVEKIIEDAHDMGVKYLTVYAFSTENWNRPEEEVKALMKLLRNYLKDCIERANKNDMRVRVIGERSRLDADIVDKINELEECSNHSKRRDYGGIDFFLSRYGGYPGSGSADSHERGNPFVQLSFMAACLYGVLFYRCIVA